MRGIKSSDLVAIVDFLYYGETNVYQDNLDSFLKIAEELSLRGLAGGKEDKDSKPTTNHPKPKPKSKIPKLKLPQIVEDDNFQGDDIFTVSTPEEVKSEFNTTVVSNISFTGELHELDEKVKKDIRLK